MATIPEPRCTDRLEGYRFRAAVPVPLALSLIVAKLKAGLIRSLVVRRIVYWAGRETFRPEERINLLLWSTRQR